MPTDAEIRSRIARYRFYHSIRLTETITTPGEPGIEPSVENALRSVQRLDLRNRRVLDVGCRDGLFCFTAERRGAREVIGIDNDLSPAAVEFLIPFFGSRVRMHQMNVLDLVPDSFGKFDVVFCLGLVYHLRYPFWAFRAMRDVLEDGGVLIVETALLVDDNRRPLLFCPTGADSPYEPSSCTFFNLRGLADSLRSFGLDVQHVDYQQPRAWAPHAPPGPWESLPEPSRGFGARLRALLAAEPRPTNAVHITRASLVCRLRRELIDTDLLRYWNHTHSFHSCSVSGQAAGTATTS